MVISEAYRAINTQLQMAEIYGVNVRTVNGHIKRFLADGEIDESVIRKFRITAADGKVYDVVVERMITRSRAGSANV